MNHGHCNCRSCQRVRMLADAEIWGVYFGIGLLVVLVIVHLAGRP